MRISDWSSDVCSSDLLPPDRVGLAVAGLVVAGLVMERVDLADAHHGVRRRPAPVRAGGGSESSRSHSLMRRTATGLSRAAGRPAVSSRAVPLTILTVSYIIARPNQIGREHV